MWPITPKLPGIQINELLPKMATLVDKYVVVRSFKLRTVDRDHSPQRRVGVAFRRRHTARPVGKVIWGGSSRCAQCHDHPFESIVQCDLLRLGGVPSAQERALPAGAASGGSRGRHVPDQAVAALISDLGQRDMLDDDIVMGEFGRRVRFDLIGLPPTPEEVRSFVTDRPPDAYEQLVDQLLRLPHYGEHWARHWLDVVRVPGKLC